MKPSFSKIAKISLLVVGALLALLLVFGIVLVLDWPWWVGIFLALGIVGIALGVLFVRKILVRKREQQFVQQVIEQNESHLQTLAGKERDDLREIQTRWKEAVDALRGSHLRKFGNPLYVLPWYMVIGESGSGKTTSIQSARLLSPFTEVNRASGISGTRNCDWWFFEQAVILDTAGRYAIPVDEGRDKEEWQRFLTLLLKYRQKEPLNGLIVAISADKLLESSPEVIEEDGKSIRRRIDELMRVLGVKFPVYVLVTKCDLVQGMTHFSEHLPEKAPDQAMGSINQDLSPDVMGFLDRAVTTIGERLRNFRILILHHLEAKTVEPPLLLFPEEFENLKRGLLAFAKGAFKENPYQETPVLRGLFFSSGRQEGTPYSHFLRALGLIGEKEVLPGTNKGLFLHDFFSKILPHDRSLFAPTKRFVQWRLLTRNLGLASWVVVVTALCGLLSFSFVKNLKIIRDASHQFAGPPTLQGSMMADLATMDRFRRAVLVVEDKNRGWWIPRFWLNESIRVERGLKSRYCTQFQNGFLAPFDKQLAAAMATVSASTPDEVIGQYVIHITRRINLLKGRLAGQEIAVLQTRPQPSYVSFAAGADQDLAPEMRKTFGSLFLHYLIWRSDQAEITKEMEVLQAWLRHLLTMKGSNLRWLVPWTDKYGGVGLITLTEFWGGDPVAGEKAVAPSFTRKGKDVIDGVIKEIEAAVSEQLIVESQKAEFEKAYRTLCFDAWYQFGMAFPKGTERLKGQKEWQQMAARVATEQGPYFALLDRIPLELELLGVDEKSPAWLQQVYQYQVIRAEGQLKDRGGLARAAEQARKLLSAIEQTVGRETGAKAIESQQAAVKSHQEYLNALAAMTPVASSRTQAFQMASQTFSEDPTTGKSPFFVASRSVAQMRSNMVKGRQPEELFWKIIAGPIEYLWAYTRWETSCYLQSQWEEKVLAEAQGMGGQQAAQILLGQDGLAWKFLRGPAAPFIGRGLKGYFAREVLGGSVPVEVPLFTFLSKGAQVAVVSKQNYPVVIRGLPTDANPEARMKPHTTRLEVQCTTGNQSLVNSNYPVSKTFTWSPETCRDVLFQIEVSNIVLTKTYGGEDAFPVFLQEFRGGHRTFAPSDFPRERAALEQLGIRYIRVNYQFSGEQKILGQLGARPGAAPRRIARCWGQ